MEEKKLTKDFEVEEKTPKKRVLIIIAVVVILGGIGSGYLLSQKVSPQETIQREISKEEIKPGVTVGVADEKSFKDSAEGKLEKGGIDGEGSHHLVRPGGDSQNVYLTSSTIELEKFVGHKVKVWGQTFAAQKAGWLMDVGKLKVLE
jgi:hypothetical protein